MVFHGFSQSVAPPSALKDMKARFLGDVMLCREVTVMTLSGECLEGSFDAGDSLRDLAVWIRSLAIRHIYIYNLMIHI